MASGLMQLGWQNHVLEGAVDWDTDDIRIALMLDTYTFSQTHEFVSDVSASILTNGRSGALTTPTVTNTVFDADNVSITPDTSQTWDSIFVFKHTGVDTTAPLLLHFQSDLIANVPNTTTGAEITIVWDSGANKIFQITGAAT